MLELKNISYVKDNKIILNNINLKLDNNKFIVITGPNGSGKSTLAKIIMGILKPTSGSIIFDGKDITNLSIDKRANLGISYSFQNPVTFKGITVYELLTIASNSKLEKDDACSILSKVGLCAKEYLNRQIDNSLSGGELKRIEIASIYARNSKLNIFDEPEAGIDLWSFTNLINLFKDIRKNNSTTLVISHQARILDEADQIILLDNGNITLSDKKILNKIKLENACPIMGGTHE